MKTDDEKLLAVRKQELKDAIGIAKGLADMFIAAAGEFAAEWIRAQVADTVTREHAHTMSLGEKLKDLKAETAQAQAAAPAATTKALAKLPWDFRSEHPPVNPSYSSPFSRLALHSGKRPPDSVDEPLRIVLGEAGRILAKYGYPKAEKDWKMYPGWRYPFGLDLSDQAVAALNVAAEADTRVLDLRQEVAKLERRIGETRAASAWDDA